MDIELAKNQLSANLYEWHFSNKACNNKYAPSTQQKVEKAVFIIMSYQKQRGFQEINSYERI